MMEEMFRSDTFDSMENEIRLLRELVKAQSDVIACFRLGESSFKRALAASARIHAAERKLGYTADNAELQP